MLSGMQRGNVRFARAGGGDNGVMVAYLFTVDTWAR
jgi:hypothetical protein